MYEKYNAKGTFFFTGYIAKKFPEVVKMIISDGHEVGCHGLNHFSDEAFDVLSYEKQVEHLKKAKEILEDISGQEVISFRAPALRVNAKTPQALQEAGFLIDSSIASQRMDIFLSFGVKKKLKWLKAPRRPYFTCQYNLARRGNSAICEFPMPAYLFPYVGTFMRISPFLTSFIRYIAFIDSKVNHTIPNFVIHPNELINEESENTKIKRRAKNYISYLLADKLRYHLKLKNLGDKAAILFEKQIKYFYDRHYKFSTLRDYYYSVVKEN